MNRLLKIVLVISVLLAILVLLAPVIFILIYVYVAKPIQISGSSMFPTYKSGQYYLVRSLDRFNISRGDVIIFRAPPEGKDEFIQRIVGLPGENIKIEAGKVYINGQLLNEGYLKQGSITTPGSYLQEGKEILIPQNKYALLGDNREHSFDSRTFGFLPKENIVGKPWFCYFRCSI